MSDNANLAELGRQVLIGNYRPQPIALVRGEGCRLFDADDQPMSPTFSYGRKGKLYRYYVSAPLQQGQRRREDDQAIRRVPAAALEARLAGIVCRVAPIAGL